MTAWPLDGVGLDSAAPSPLHSQLASALRGRIEDRRLQPGESLPSEAELQARLGISRSVVRQALSTLATEGLIHRSRGRGSVVAPARQHHRLAHRAAGLSSQVAESGSDVRTEVLSLGPSEQNPHFAQFGEGTLAMERLRSIDGTPSAYIRTWLPESFGAGLDAEQLTDASLHRLLEQAHGIELTGGRREVRAVAADDTLAQLLNTPKGAPLLLLEGTTTESHGVVVEAFSTWHRGDLIAFALDVEDGGGACATGPGPERDQLVQAERTATQLAETLRGML